MRGCGWLVVVDPSIIIKMCVLCEDEDDEEEGGYLL